MKNDISEGLTIKWVDLGGMTHIGKGKASHLEVDYQQTDEAHQPQAA